MAIRTSSSIQIISHAMRKRYQRGIKRQEQQLKHYSTTVLFIMVFCSNCILITGANFESKLLTELCSIASISKSRTTPYHPMGNGMTERFNRTLLDMIGTLDPETKMDWKNHLAPLVHAYNVTRHESTGQSPFFLMFS